MNDLNPTIQEYLARKTHVLNLEMRQFMLLFALEALFLLFYIVWYSKLKNNKMLSLLALSVYLTFFFELLAINGKMGLISVYLRQMENYFRGIGYYVVWESVALDKIIFVPGNAFTLPAFFTILIIFSQLIYVFYFTLKTFIIKSKNIIISTIFLSIIILFLIIKSITVDFFRQIPNIF